MKGGGFDTEPEGSLPAPSGLLAGYSAAAGVATRRVRSLIVDVFPDEAGRQAHLEAGKASLMDGAPELFAEPPSIGYTDIVAARIPATNPLATALWVDCGHKHC